MKKFLLLFVLFFSVNLIKGQTVFKDYTDGKLYVKMSKVSIKNIQNENPRNIPLQKLSIFFINNKSVNITEYFKAPYFVYPKDETFDLSFFTSQKAKSVYRIFEESKNTKLEKDVDKSK
jgi:hypothetical protein